MTAANPARADDGFAFPAAAVLPETSVKAWARQTAILTGRQVIVAVRDVPTIVQLVVFPALTLLMFKVVLGDIVSRATGQDSVYGTVPLVILVSAMTGTVVSALRLNLERRSGLLSRLYVLPLNRSADFTARVAAELIRAFLTTVALLIAGVAIGFRFTQGIGSAIGLIAVALAYAAAFAMFTLAVAVNAAPGAPLVQFISLMTTVLMFFNSGFSPVDAYPGWLQPIVANQPMTPAIDVMRAFASGGPITWNLLKVAIWVAIALAVCVYPALRGYRKAAAGR